MSKTLSLDNNGYVYVLIYNLSGHPVYFDDLTITHAETNVLELNDYYPFGYLIHELSWQSTDPANKYKYNGIELQSDLNLNIYNAFYRSLDPVTGRWLEIDPKTNYQMSPYCSMNGNPILNCDPLGDIVKTNLEGAENTRMAMESILDGKTNPIGFDKEKGLLTYDDKVDVSEYSSFQKDVLGRYKELITNETDVNLKIVDKDEKVYKEQSLAELNASGLTVKRTEGDKTSEINVFVARNPVKRDGSPEKKEYAGVTNIHKLGGHSFLYLTQPELKVNDHNKRVEDLHRQIFLNYKVNGALWYKRSEVPLHKREKE